MRGREKQKRNPLASRRNQKRAPQLTPFCSPPSVPPADLAALHSLFDRNLPRALALAESGGVTRYIGQPSGRSVFQVRAGSHGARGRRGHHHQAQQPSAAAHTTFPPHFCTCDAFYFDVAHKADAAACKHQLAARLAESLGTASEVPVPDEVLARLLIAG